MDYSKHNLASSIGDGCRAIDMPFLAGHKRTLELGVVPSLFFGTRSLLRRCSRRSSTSVAGLTPRPSLSLQSMIPGSPIESSPSPPIQASHLFSSASTSTYFPLKATLRLRFGTRRIVLYRPMLFRLGVSKARQAAYFVQCIYFDFKILSIERWHTFKY